MADRSNYYEVLGVTPSASMAEVRRAYRRGARALHPDLNPASDATQRFIELKSAYDVLKNPLLRRQYDQRVGVSTNHPGTPPPRPSAAKPPPPRTNPDPTAGRRTYRQYRPANDRPYAKWSADFASWSKDILGPPEETKAAARAGLRMGMAVIALLAAFQFCLTLACVGTGTTFGRMRVGFPPQTSDDWLVLSVLAAPLIVAAVFARIYVTMMDNRSKDIVIR